MALECERWQWRELFASEHGPDDPSTRLVLFVLSLHMNQDGGNAFPAQELIAKRSGLSVRSVRTHLANAAQAGWLKIYQKTQKGKAWYVHEYVATIPDELAEFCTAKPWEDDPQWQRPANSAGRSTKSKPQRPANSAGRQGSERLVPKVQVDQRPANGAERPAILAPRPANDDTTTGNLRHNDRQSLPTNSSSNSSSNSSLNSPVEGALASDRTALAEHDFRKGESKAVREQKAATLMHTTPDIEIAKVAKMFRLSEQDVLKLKPSTP